MVKKNLIVIVGQLLVSMIFITGCYAEKENVIRTTPHDTIAGNEILNEQGNAAGNYSHVTTNDTVHDVVNHPAFKGFGKFILPLDRGRYDMSMQLNRVASLLPYHGHVDPNAVVGTLNYMIDKVGAGETVFYDFYTEQQKKEEPSKNATGLFFFRGKPGATFAMICPGGGFTYVGSVHEGFPYAIELSKKGYSAFVLQYRVGGERTACEDLAAALSFIFKNADKLGVSTNGYSLWGSSAGARMTARLGSTGAAGYGGDNLPRPGTVVMAYTGHSDFSRNDPPTFVTVSANDNIVNVSTVQRRIAAMRNTGIEVEYREYKSAGHGFGLGIGTDAEGWIKYVIDFWEKHMND